MARPQKGAVWFDRKRGYWVAQLNWTDDAGKRKQRKRKIENKSAGWDLIDDWKAELKQQGLAYLDAETITFAQLAAEYEAKRLVPAEYRDGKKVKGMRDWKNARTRLKIAIAYFGKKRIRNITYADV